MTDSTGSCGGHAGLSAELRALALAALDRLGPLLERVRAEPSLPAAGTCASCPVCAVLAALRGERPELAVRLADHASGLLAVLRAALAEGSLAGPSIGTEGSLAGPSIGTEGSRGGASSNEEDAGPTARPEPTPAGRRVQRIRVDRVAP